MADEESTNSKVADVANAVAAVAKEVPIYQDALQPAAQEIGKALGTVAKLVNVALAPVSGLVWGYEQIRGFTATKVAEKLKGVSPEKIVTPSPNVAGPAIEALRYTGHEESLSEMYASLLATAMNKDTIQKAHPAFVDIIKQLTPDEAKIVRGFAENGINNPLVSIKASPPNESLSKGFQVVLRNFSQIGQRAGCEFNELVPVYLDNLVRMGLCEIPSDQFYMDAELYEPLINHPDVISTMDEMRKNNRETSISQGIVSITDFGRQFSAACCPPVVVHIQAMPR
ncbi:DUF4393 domain-containing protein [Cronobacter malonaticus]|uniref:DUF4393 domain-containing protein n=1 Tax=Cronobacter malonaticus TaxID=413503 RepID=UPI00067BF6CF|nr:DUF4393 domain-containing protein [Cronobacter malonaticus]EGT4384001.1 DUF4393 domain-containing protein [Cronobacter malonaticus]EGT4423241.1 DUF4393 domain-containing protein [Cronobacter malonaticus]EGT4445478.1 DUF4393 domain-containing protein [Cronobacter malonaticus]EGT4456565.1 DUF4393 domain-containing protein [Cronobacter malonaticus]EKP4391940.1 DUF4393 domain-containing protein [Cronobacter malonaticus]